jgi:hypothetical protein
MAVMPEIAMTSISATNTIPMFFVFIEITSASHCTSRGALREFSGLDSDFFPIATDKWAYSRILTTVWAIL